MDFSRIQVRGKGYVVRGVKTFTRPAWQLIKYGFTWNAIEDVLKAGFVVVSGVVLDYGSAFFARSMSGYNWKQGLPVTAVLGGLAILIEYKNDPRLYEALGLDFSNPDDVALIGELARIVQQDQNLLANFLLGLEPNRLMDFFKQVNITRELLCFVGETGYALAAEDGFDATVTWGKEVLVKLNLAVNELFPEPGEEGRVTGTVTPYLNPKISPIVLDLDGDGLETSGVNDSRARVKFQPKS